MKGTMQLMIWRVFAYALAFAILPICVSAQTSNPAPVSPVANPCPRSREGSVVTAPHAFFGHDGVLRVNFSYQKRVDPDGRILFCFMTPEGYENPTLHIHPGDHLIINVTNNTPSSPVEMAMPWPHCGDSVMTGSSPNIHYHGTNVSPTCGQDDVIHTAISSGQTFQYNVAFPSDE